MTAATSFPGFGDTAPLDLPAGGTDVLGRLLDGTHDAYADTLAGVGNCTRPIRLHGSSVTVDSTTGEVLASFRSADAPLGELYVPCGNRRAHVCPACSRVYARDTYEVIRTGVVGGKTVPAEVACAPLLFVTFTAPSFGLVHGHRPDGKPCRPRSSDRVETCPHGVRLACSARHDEGDEAVGSPLCWDCYDWTSAVVWQWHAPELWRRTTNTLRRALAHHLDIPASRLRDVVSVQFAKVAEYQARGLIHFHAMIRLDGPDGPGSPSPVDADTLAGLVRTVAAAVTLLAPPTHEDDSALVIGWGRQLDVKTVRPGRALTATDPTSSETLSGEQVAAYLAKYASKDAADLRTDGSRPHLARLSAECRRLHEHAIRRDELRRAGLATVVELDAKTGRDPYALLGKWAHMLGFRGHFSTRSRRYSVTLGRLRRAGARFRRLLDHSQRTGQPLDTRDLERRLLADDEDETTLVIGSWTYAGTGWPRPGDAVLAAAAAARAREYDQWRAADSR